MNGKKKLVYKQNPDGVFRLKKIDDTDKLSTKSDKRTVDDYLNDLISCAYEVVDPNKPPSESPPSSPSPGDKLIKLNNQGNTVPSAPNLNHQETMPTITPSLKIDTTSPTLNATNHPNANGNINTPHKDFIKDFSPGLNIMTPSPTSTKPKLITQVNSTINMFHIPSFGVGIIIAIILNQLSPQLLYYGKITFNYAKIGIVWAIILGTIAWYTGLIKTDEFSFPSLLSTIKSKLNYQQSPPPTVTLIDPMVDHGYNDSPITIHDDAPLMAQAYEESVERPPSAVEQQRRQPLPRRHTDRPLHNKPRPSSSRQKSASPTRLATSRKNTITNVMPYKPQQRSQSAMVTPIEEKPKLTEFPSTEPKSNYSRFIERSKKQPHHHKPNNSIDSFDSSHLRNPNLPYPGQHNGQHPQHPGIHHVSTMPIMHSHQLNGRLTPPQDQPLPELPDEDLPFIHEVKLVNKYDEFTADHDEVGELPGFGMGMPKRLNTTASKKSVLGTRANYSKFVEGVGDYD